MAAYSAAQNRASQKYRAAKIKRVPLDVPITEYEAFKTACDAQGDKLNTVLREAMQEYVKRYSDAQRVQENKTSESE